VQPVARTPERGTHHGRSMFVIHVACVVSSVICIGIGIGVSVIASVIAMAVRSVVKVIVNTGIGATINIRSILSIQTKQTQIHGVPSHRTISSRRRAYKGPNMAATLRRMHANITRSALLPFFPPKVDVERRVVRQSRPVVVETELDVLARPLARQRDGKAHPGVRGCRGARRKSSADGRR
jgi:hypothetical protein